VDLLTVFQQVLELEGCAVVAAATAEEALAHLAENEPPDVILCDLSLPGIDGFEFLRRARQLPGMKRVPALALSGFSEAADVRSSQESGFLAHLIKPVPLDELRSHILRALDSARSDGATAQGAGAVGTQDATRPASATAATGALGDAAAGTVASADEPAARNGALGAQAVRDEALSPGVDAAQLGVRAHSRAG
ncbi:MAG TPA: response regulator, partial [Limnochordales bacterium]